MFLFKRLQTELSDGIAVLVASNDHIQEMISQMEETCSSIEVSLNILFPLVFAANLNFVNKKPSQISP